MKNSAVLRKSYTGVGCFAKGTPVHTKDGLKPIEKIKVGDYVLSSPEGGAGSPEYKRVINTFKHKDKTIREVYSCGDATTAEYVLAATGNHPFWVEGMGWTRADQLQRGDVVRKADGSSSNILNQYPVYRTQSDGIGWVQALEVVRTSYGTLFDYENYAVVPRRNTVYLPTEVHESDDPYLHVTVYNLEVEDYHTYFVGRDGIWVHNTNCNESVKFTNIDPATKKIPPILKDIADTARYEGNAIKSSLESPKEFS